MKSSLNTPSYDSEGYYLALDDSCSSATDEELGFEILTRINNVPSNKVTSKQLQNARLKVNHCRLDRYNDAFKTSELMVIQNMTGIPSVLMWMCGGLGYEQPNKMLAAKRLDHINSEESRLKLKLEALANERAVIQPIVEREARPPPTLVDYPGHFSADTILFERH